MWYVRDKFIEITRLWAPFIDFGWYIQLPTHLKLRLQEDYLLPIGVGVPP